MQYQNGNVFYEGRRIRHRSLMHVLTLVIFGVSSLLAFALQHPQAAYAANLTVTTTSDLVINDGAACSLREAILEANNPGGFGLVGECPQASDTETDAIFLENGQTYTLSIGAGDNTANAGDLDIVDSAAELDLIITTVNPEGAPATIDATGLAGDRVLQVLTGASARLENLIITGGSVPFSGGGIFNNGTLELVSTTVTDNEVTDSTFEGGGIENSTAGVLILNGSTVSDNEMINGGNGGGIANRGTLTIENGSLVFGNSTTNGNGGGIYNADEGTLTIRNSTIGSAMPGQSNVATSGSGGGIYNTDMATLTISTTAIIVNVSTVSGGGLWNNSITTIMTGTQIGAPDQANATVGDGGGVHNAANGEMTITDGTISSNVAGFFSVAAVRGGGIFNEGNLTINTTSIASNAAGVSNTNGSQGGGIYNMGSLNMTGGEIVENRTGDGTDSNGGGVAHFDGVLQLTDVTVRRNETGEGDFSSGGGLWNNDEMRLSNTNVIENETGNGALSRGGGIANSNVAVLEMEGGTISRNNTGNGSTSTGGGISSFGEVTIDGTDIAENFTGTGNNSAGGGIFAGNGTINLDDATVRDNNTGSGSSSFGGGIAAFNNLAVVNIRNSVISGNATGTGIANGNDGAGIWNDHILNISNTTIRNNTTGGEDNDGGGLYNHAGGIASIDSTLIEGNSASELGNAASGGGIFNLGTVAMRNSTVSTNTARTIGGGIYTGSNSNLTLLFSTIANNEIVDGTAGGLWVDNLVSSTTLKATIIANNVAPFNPDCEDVVNTIVTEGYNVLGIGDGCANLVDGVNNDQVGSSATPLDARISNLDNNGGPTMSHMPLAGSVALDTVPGTECVDLLMVAVDDDQRGMPRPANTNCDSGAVEVDPSELIREVYMPLVIR